MRLVVYYIMGGIEVDMYVEILIKGLYVVGECVFLGLYGVNCLGFNLLVEFVVFGKVVGENVVCCVLEVSFVN